MPMADTNKFIPVADWWEYIYSCHRVIRINFFPSLGAKNKFIPVTE